jgi:hypothetical protein
LKLKYKQERKVREAHRKERREARKNPELRKCMLLYSDHDHDPDIDVMAMVMVVWMMVMMVDGVNTHTHTHTHSLSLSLSLSLDQFWSNGLVLIFVGCGWL